MEYRFNQFRLDPERKLFYQNNELIETEARALHLIHLLLQCYPETITRHSLLDTLWPNQEISDSALSQLIHRARQLLNDDGRSPTYIKTIHGVGVRFLVEPTEAHAPAPGTTPHHDNNSFSRWWLAIPLVLMAGLGIHYFQPGDDTLTELGSYPYTVAVLPFENGSEDEANAWIRLGLMDMVGALLSEPAGIKIIGTKDVVSYLSNKPVGSVFSNPQDMQQAFDSLCPALGCQILVAARLDDTPSKKQLSYQIATRKGVHPVKIVQGNTVIEAGSNLAHDITRLINPAQPWIVNSRSTYSTDDAANRAYALGVQELFDGDAKAAVQYLNIALQKAPAFHWAKVKLSDALYRLYDLDQSAQVIEELLATENLPDDIRYQALHVQSNLLYSQGKFTESRHISETLLQIAIKAEDLVLQGAELMSIGTSYQAAGDAAQALIYLKRAEQQYREAHYKPGIGSVLFNTGNAHLTVKEYSQASAYYQKAELLFQQLGNQQRVAMVRFQQADVLISAGQLAKAKRMLDDLLPMFEKLDDKQSVALTRINLGYIEILEGHYDPAIQKLLALLPQLQTQQLTYAIDLAKTKLAHAYLNQHKPHAAKAYIQQEPEDPITGSGTALLSAHLAYEEHRFADAVAIAKRVKQAAGSAWLSEQEALLKAYQVALSSGEWKEVTF